MLIACVADIHDRITTLDKALDDIARHNPDVLICCGDLTSGEIVKRLFNGFPKEIHLCNGNNDDELEIKRTIDTERLLRVYYHRLFGRLRFDNRRVAFTHKPKDAEPLLTEGFDIIFYGHTHTAKIQQEGDTWVVNPGDIQGRFGATPSYVIYDTESNEPTLHEIS